MIDYPVSQSFTELLESARIKSARLNRPSKYERSKIVNKMRELYFIIERCVKIRALTIKSDLRKNPNDCINLATVSHNLTIQKGYVIIKIGEVQSPIKIKPGVAIENNYDPTMYSINKYGSEQYIEKACDTDQVLYRIIKIYNMLKLKHKI